MTKKILMIFCILIFFVASNIFCQSNKFPSVEPHVIFDFDRTDLTARQMIEVALCFSDCPVRADYSKYLQQYDELEKRVSTKYFKALSQREQAEEILMIMYEKTLRRYSLKQTCLTTLFDEGTYNCVSSSVLYMALAKAAGLTVIGNRTTEHCFCSVIIDGQKIDVETTNPMGFNPGEKRMLEQNGNGTKYAVVPKKTYNGRYEVSQNALVSLVARNVTAFQLDKKNYSVAIPVAASRYVFMKDEINKKNDDSRLDFDLAVSNYAAELQQRKLYLDSMEWMDFVVNRWGMSEGLEYNYCDAIYNGVLALCNSGRISDAKKTMEQKKNLIREADFEELSTIIFVKESESMMNDMSNSEEKIKFIRSQKNNSLARDDRAVLSQLDILLENIWVQKIIETINKNQFLEAVTLIESAQKDLPNSSNLKKMKQNCLSNYDVTVHNRFAELANKGNYSGAKKVLEEGLKNHPESSTLKKDLTTINRMMNQ